MSARETTRSTNCRSWGETTQWSFQGRVSDMRPTTDPVIEVVADIWCQRTNVGVRIVGERRTMTGHYDVASKVPDRARTLFIHAPLHRAITGARVDHLREWMTSMVCTDFGGDQFPTSSLAIRSLVRRATRTRIRLKKLIDFAGAKHDLIRFRLLRISWRRRTTPGSAA